jgi:hypothetical protein
MSILKDWRRRQAKARVDQMARFRLPRQAKADLTHILATSAELASEKFSLIPRLDRVPDGYSVFTKAL